MSSSASDHTSTPGKSPAFQFYAKEFLSDANQAGMSLQETGAYIRLICFEWNVSARRLRPTVLLRRSPRIVAVPQGVSLAFSPISGASFDES